MSGLLKWFVPVVALMVLAAVSGPILKADDTTTAPATSQPSGSIAVTILDSDGKPVEKCKVNLYATKKKADDPDAKPKKSGKMLQSGKTDEDGKFTFENLASADYAITASSKSVGKGTAIASVTDDAPSATVTITLASASAPPATAPSADASK
jgi:uncharacterized surface anchored protein